jgi:ribonuclease E
MATTRKMLINATQPEELRVAIVQGNELFDFDLDRKGKTKKKSSIYKGTVTRVEPSLEAAFIDYGADRHGFLPVKEVAREYFHPSSNYQRGRPQIRDILKPGQELIVQVDKEERGTKGAALSTFVGLAGCYLVLMPNNPRAGGISRRIEGEERDDLKEAVSQLEVPNGMGLIVRTAGVGRSVEELQWDLDVLLSQWDAIEGAANSRPAPFLIHQEGNVIARAMRDYLRPDISEIIVDTADTYKQVVENIQHIRPEFVERVKLYKDQIPLFNRYQIESQIESAFQRSVALPNGSSIVIDNAEALIAIDINSAKATEGGDIEETALQTNLAAAHEIARQLRTRDIGGLIVIDFIDMTQTRNQRLVEDKLREELRHDRARIQTGRISRFGLLEMSRQRLRPSLGESIQVTCPRCDGQGNIRNVPSLAITIARIIEDEAMKENTAQVNVILPVEISTYLLNEKRESLLQLEHRHNIRIHLIPNPNMETPKYEIRRIKTEEMPNNLTPSYKVAHKVKEDIDELSLPHAKIEDIDEPAIKTFSHSSPAPKAKKDTEGLIKRLWAAVFGATDKPLPQTREKKQHGGRPQNRTRRRGGDRNRQGGHRKDGQRRDNQKRDHYQNRNRQENDSRNEGNRNRTEQDNSRNDGNYRSNNRQDNRGNRQEERYDNRPDNHNRQDNRHDNNRPDDQNRHDNRPDAQNRHDNRPDNHNRQDNRHDNRSDNRNRHDNRQQNQRQDRTNQNRGRRKQSTYDDKKLVAHGDNREQNKAAMEHTSNTNEKVTNIDVNQQATKQTSQNLAPSVKTEKPVETQMVQTKQVAEFKDVAKNEPKIEKPVEKSRANHTSFMPLTPQQVKSSKVEFSKDEARVQQRQENIKQVSCSDGQQNAAKAEPVKSALFGREEDN